MPLEIPKGFRLDPDKLVTDRTADFSWESVNTGPWRMQGFFRGYKVCFGRKLLSRETAGFLCVCQQIQYWRSDLGVSSMKEHVIIHREPGPCWRESGIGYIGRVRRDISSGHVYNLIPFTNFTARVLALNAKYESPPSEAITFGTSEGGRGLNFIKQSCDYICELNFCSS